MPKIFSIYPTDKQQSTKFLNRINTYLKRELKNDWHCYKIKFNDQDHSDCIKKCLKSDAKLILFMGHGRSDSLFGSCRNESYTSQDLDDYDKFYNNESFINSSNIGMFQGKIFFSFSCNSNRNSNDSIGRLAIKNGVKTFIGFGDIPTDYIEEKHFPKVAIAIYKSVIISVIKSVLALSIKENYTVQYLVDTIRLQIIKEIQNLIFSNWKQRHKNQIIQMLYNFSSEILVLGDGYERMF